MPAAGTKKGARDGVTFPAALRTLLTVLAVSYFAFWACCPQNQCATGADCDTGYCSGYVASLRAGTCCATACDGRCETCATGTCLPIREAAACVSDGTKCGGVCDGVHPACIYAATGV